MIRWTPFLLNVRRLLDPDTHSTTALSFLQGIEGSKTAKITPSLIDTISSFSDVYGREVFASMAQRAKDNVFEDTDFAGLTLALTPVEWAGVARVHLGDWYWNHARYHPGFAVGIEALDAFLREQGMGAWFSLMAKVFESATYLVSRDAEDGFCVTPSSERNAFLVAMLRAWSEQEFSPLIKEIGLDFAKSMDRLRGDPTKFRRKLSVLRRRMDDRSAFSPALMNVEFALNTAFPPPSTSPTRGTMEGFFLSQVSFLFFGERMPLINVLSLMVRQVRIFEQLVGRPPAPLPFDALLDELAEAQQTFAKNPRSTSASLLTLIDLPEAKVEGVLQELERGTLERFAEAPDDLRLGDWQASKSNPGVVVLEVPFERPDGTEQLVRLEVRVNNRYPPLVFGRYFQPSRCLLLLPPGWTVGQMRSEPGKLRRHLWLVLLHELTHALDPEKAETTRIENDEPENRVAYTNHPVELRAFLQQVSAEARAALRASAPPASQRASAATRLKKALASTVVWPRIEPHLTPANREALLGATLARLRQDGLVA